MTSNASEIILHNYPQSPVAEKVRTAFGIKGLTWRSVEIPRLPPKPMLTKLTGGYRRTPVMQIGADMYCDSQCIIRELERRQPSPTFFPASDTGLMWCLSRWTDGELFDLSVKLVLGAAGGNLPEEFAKDRGRLYLGPDWKEGLKRAHEEVSHIAAQMRGPFTWLDGLLSDGRTFILGEMPGAIDAQFYHVVWFVHGRWDRGPEFLSEFPALLRWKENVQAIGHGMASGMKAEEAIDRAANCKPLGSEETPDVDDPQGLKPGQIVQVATDVDGGEESVEGVIVALNAETITLTRTDADIGDVHVHFPRAGYLVRAV